jgi:hypothetical protein
MRESGWLQQVFAAANQRVEQWPEWKKQIESRDLDSQCAADNEKESALGSAGKLEDSQS